MTAAPASPESPSAPQDELKSQDAFERFPALASWIERLANASMDLSLGDWMVFIGALNAALQSSEAAHAQALALLRTVPSGVSAEVDAWRREATLAALSEKPDLEESSRSHPSGEASAGAEVFAGLDAETSAAWRPIETAPKDGTMILASGTQKADFGAPEGPFLDTVWWEHGLWQDGSLAQRPSLTHWMPLPEAPK